MSLQVLPLAITMMAGPQILSAIVLVTSRLAVPASVAFAFGVATATIVGVALARLLAGAVSLGDPANNGSLGKIIQIVLVALLAAASVSSYLRRERIKPPEWLGRLQQADVKLGLRTGLLIILFMPSDIVVMLTVGTNLAQTDASFLEALPFVGATALIAALPLLTYLLFRRRAERAMPEVRDWMSTHSWLVNIIVYCIFIVLIVA